MNGKLSCAFALLILNKIIQISESTDSHEYKFIFEKMTKDKDDESKVKTLLNFSKLDQEHFEISGTVEQLVEMDDNWKVSITIYRAEKAGDEFHKVFALPTQGLCQILKNHYKRFFYDSLKNYANVPHYDTCPLAPEKYVINNYPFDASKFKRFLRPGYYRIQTALRHADSTDIEYNLFGNVLDA